MVKMGGSGGRVRSASAGRDKRTEMACRWEEEEDRRKIYFEIFSSRYWAILVENLRRAVDDLYRTCEGDESCMYAREVIMVLDNYTRDFKSLVKWLKLKVEYENTPPPQRPTSLTWDIRKTSPMGKVTPASTPGKLTPTRQLLLVSPAKRQLEFTEGETRARSRQVSETIKEVGMEADFSPHQSWQDLKKFNNFRPGDSEELEPEEICSEHEKSDSEQEKDVATPVVEIFDKKVEENNVDEMTKSTESAISETELTSKSSSSTDLSQGQGQVKRNVSKLGPRAKAKPVAKPQNNPVKTVTEKTGKSSKVILGDKITKTNEKPTNNNVKVQSHTAPTASTTAKSQAAPPGGVSCRREKSEDKAKSGAKITSTFASKVKSVPKTVLSSVTPSVPKMTRAKTTITPASTRTTSSASSRKTAAGLLITATAKSRPSSVSKPSTARTTPATASTAATVTAMAGSSSPKQQRISLVARQSMFASENRNPNRKVNRAETGRAGKAGSGGGGGKVGVSGDQNRNTTNPAGEEESPVYLQLSQLFSQAPTPP